MPKTSSKLSEYEVLGGIGSGSYGTCKKVSRKSDAKVGRDVETSYIYIAARELLIFRCDEHESVSCMCCWITKCIRLSNKHTDSSLKFQLKQ